MPAQYIFTACASELAAIEFMEKHRWGEYPACPDCGGMDVYQMRQRKTGEREKHYRWRCRDCGILYSVRKGTVFEDSRIPLRHWCFAFWRFSISKKGCSALEISRALGISYKSAHRMCRCIREAAMHETIIKNHEKLDGIVEADETYIGGKISHRRGRTKNPWDNKIRVMAIVQRGGRVKFFVMPKSGYDSRALRMRILKEHVSQESQLMTDGEKCYSSIGKYFKQHEIVNHSAKEYVRGNFHTNSVEGVFSLVKGGIKGIYHSVSKKYLFHYLSEFEFRHNTRHLSDYDRLSLLIRLADSRAVL